MSGLEPVAATHCAKQGYYGKQKNRPHTRKRAMEHSDQELMERSHGA